MSQETDWKKQRKLIALPGKSESPELVLARTLEKARAGYIKSVAIAIVWNDDENSGSVESDWSTGSLRDLLYSIEHLKLDCYAMMEGRFDDRNNDGTTGSPQPA